jgi:polyhydroxyalkanoate synthesis repressor PhaR
MGETRVVKRYANRKLYDTQRSRYVTLEQIADMIRGGEDVKIVDNNSKEDLTAITLTQIIFEEEKKQSFLPLSALRNIIQSGANNMTQLATQAGERMRGMFKRDREDEPGANGEGSPLEEVEAGAAPGSGSTNPIREFLERSQQTFDEWQKKVDERIRSTVDALSPLSGIEKEMRALAQRLSDLEKRLEERE